MIKYCDNCKGKKVLVGLGNIEVQCYYCDGVGYVKQDQDNAEQDKISYSKDREGEAHVDTLSTNRRKRKRQIRRGYGAVGSSTDHIQECEESRESSEEIGCDQSEEIKSGEQV